MCTISGSGVPGGQASAASTRSVVAVDRPEDQTSSGMTSVGIQAPSVNFETTTTIVTAAVAARADGVDGKATRSNPVRGRASGARPFRLATA